MKSTKSKILVIDDNAVNLKFLSLILGREGFDVLQASDSTKALSLAEQLRPDLILLDVMMPNVSGLDLLHSLKTGQGTSAIPVVMITALNQGKDVREALEAGAFDYIKKPLDEIEVVARVKSALGFKAQQDRLIEMASRDSLTGLYNHHLLVDLLGRELASAKRKGQVITFCMADIDHFKTINDTHGHPVGDKVLVQVSSLLAQAVRKIDIVGRYGGEEFGLVLGACPIDKAQRLCEKLRNRVAGHQFEAGGAHFSVTLSLGLAQALPDQDLDEIELVKRADQALYRAKEAGRNRIVLA